MLMPAYRQTLIIIITLFVYFSLKVSDEKRKLFTKNLFVYVQEN